jgi:signal transduction histidine kinase/ActR/RegA family two-component response regulator
MSKPKVLIVNKNDSSINEIEALLSGSNIDLVKASSANEAIEYANRFEFALVMIEIAADDPEGIKIAEIIRREKKHKHLNILYLTDDCCETYYGKEFANTMAVDFIARSFIHGILKGKVESVIIQYNQRKQLELELEQRKIIEKELKEAKRLEEEAVVAKKQFLSTMSHEIRTPLNAIINTINLLISDKPRKDQAEDMDVLKFSAENLLQLINEILDYSKIDAGKIEFEEIDFNVRKLIAGIQQSLQYGMVKNGIALEFKVDENVPTFLAGDSVRLAQIIFNLVGNALKFTEKGKVSFTASVYRDMDNYLKLKFTISDTGIGIPEDKQQYIFEAFTQASASTTREYGGTGLGLAITKMLVEKQGGTIEVKSKQNEGTTFSVFLKFKKSEKNQEEEKPHKTPEIHSLEGINVLVVEDNLINQNIVYRLLVKWNANADTAENGKIAVQKVRNNHYQLVLMDLHMPEMSGYEATQKIREMEGDYYKTLPILAVTASAFAEDRKKICASGMNGYIIKPFHPAELNSKISRFLNRKMLIE